MRAELNETVEKELRRFAADLNLTDAQKTQFKAALENAHERIDEAKAKNPNATRADVVAKLKENRTQLRARVEKFLTPEQLVKWDAEAAKAKEYLGERLDS